MEGEGEGQEERGHKGNKGVTRTWPYGEARCAAVLSSLCSLCAHAGAASVSSLPSHPPLPSASHIPVPSPFPSQTILALLPNLSVDPLRTALFEVTNDQHLVLYVASLVRAVTSLHDLVSNKAKTKDGDVAEEKKPEDKDKKEKEDKEKKEKEKDGAAAKKEDGAAKGKK